MEYSQNDMLGYYTTNSGHRVYKLLFQYAADKAENKAALNFHLTRREEKDIIASINAPQNQKNFQQLLELFNKKNENDSIRVE